MKKSILSLGKMLSQKDQKEIQGGFGLVNELCTSGSLSVCSSDNDCCMGETCNWVPITYRRNLGGVHVQSELRCV